MYRTVYASNYENFVWRCVVLCLITRLLNAHEMNEIHKGLHASTPHTLCLYNECMLVARVWEIFKCSVRNMNREENENELNGFVQCDCLCDQFLDGHLPHMQYAAARDFGLMAGLNIELLCVHCTYMMSTEHIAHWTLNINISHAMLYLRLDHLTVRLAKPSNHSVILWFRFEFFYGSVLSFFPKRLTMKNRFKSSCVCVRPDK